MIFGFNTDIKHGDTVYHVQSEARESELLAADPGFRPRPLHRQAGDSYRRKLAEAQFTDQQKEHGLRDQHRLVLDAIRDGQLDDVLDKRETRRPWPRSKNWTCSGSTPIPSTPTAI